MALLDNKEVLNLLVDDIVEFEDNQLQVNEKIVLTSVMREYILFLFTKNNLSLLFDKKNEKYYFLKEENIDLEKMPRNFDYKEMSFKRSFRDFLGMTKKKAQDQVNHSKSKTAVYNGPEGRMILCFTDEDRFITYLGLPADTESLTIYASGDYN